MHTYSIAYQRDMRPYHKMNSTLVTTSATMQPTTRRSKRRRIAPMSVPAWRRSGRSLKVVGAASIPMATIPPTHSPSAVVWTKCRIKKVQLGIGARRSQRPSGGTPVVTGPHLDDGTRVAGQLHAELAPTSVPALVQR